MRFLPIALAEGMAESLYKLNSYRKRLQKIRLFCAFPVSVLRKSLFLSAFSLIVYHRYLSPSPLKRTGGLQENAWLGLGSLFLRENMLRKQGGL